MEEWARHLVCRDTIMPARTAAADPPVSAAAAGASGCTSVAKLSGRGHSPHALRRRVLGPHGSLRRGQCFAPGCGLFAQSDLLHEGHQVVKRYSSTICPFFQWPTVQKSTSNDLPVGGISVPSGPTMGPVMVPV
jgi:hypothetical protein